MSASKKWDKATLKIVQGFWALLMATVMISAAIFYVFPHLMEDEQLTSDDIGLLSGMVVVAIVIAIPSVSMQVLGGIVNAWRSWRNGKGT